MDLIFALFVYPGLIPAVLLTLLFNFLVSQRRLVLPPDLMKAVLSTDGLSAIVSAILAISALVYMPWPFNPAYSNVAGPLLMWAALEAAFLVPSLVAQTSSSPMVVRGAARSLQIGLAGRIVIWCVFGALYWANQTAGWYLGCLRSLLPSVLVCFGMTQHSLGSLPQGLTFLPLP
ncbi:MAG: hypothetical protein RI985_813 [Chloroflexota bacterium]